MKRTGVLRVTHGARETCSIRRVFARAVDNATLSTHPPSSTYLSGFVVLTNGATSGIAIRWESQRLQSILYVSCRGPKFEVSSSLPVTTRNLRFTRYESSCNTKCWFFRRFRRSCACLSNRTTSRNFSRKKSRQHRYTKTRTSALMVARDKVRHDSELEGYQ